MAKKKQPIEYRLLVQPAVDDIQKKEGFLFLLETSKQFTNFSYVIDVKDEVKGKDVVWTLHGLRAPSMNMPATGTAQFKKFYSELPKSINFTLVKKDKIKAETEFSFMKNGVRSAITTSEFLRIYTDEQEFETKRQDDVVMAQIKPDIRRELAKPKKK